MALRLSLKTRLFGAFAIVLAPVLVLLLMSYRDALRTEQEAVLGAQMLTAQAVAVQVDQAFDSAIGLGWAVALDPLVRTFDSDRLDAHLRKIVEHHPQYDAINVFDAEGVNRGWGHESEPAAPRLRIDDRGYFQRAKATNQPVISGALLLRRPSQIGFIVAVPIRDDHGAFIGLVNVVTRADLLADGYAAARLREGQAILLTDPSGQIAFMTLRPDIPYELSRAYRDFPLVKSALAGEPTLAPDFLSPLLGDRRIGAFVRTERHGWVVGVSIPREVAFEPSRASFRKQLWAWVAIVCLSGLLASVLVRWVGRPVKRLEAHANAIGAGELERRVEIRTGDELEQLGTAFNDMAAKLAQREQELREAQVELVRRERLAAVGELAAVIAHEVRNPLGVIFNAVAALRRSGTAPSDCEALHEILQEEADRLNRIVGDLLDFARPMQPALEPADVVGLLRDATATVLLSGASVDPHEKFEPDLPLVSMDARMIRQALVNVAANAVQAMPKGGVIELGVRREARARGDGVRIDIRDEGVGIPPELRARIAEPFFTTKAKGTGLGLAVVKRIVQEHSGEFGFDSVEGKGTTVTLWLPLVTRLPS